MANLEEKLLGEKREYYCSSDEEEEKDNDKESNDGDIDHSNRNYVDHKQTKALGSSQTQQRWDGVSKNTGPKGVLEDWNLFQKHEEKMRLKKEQELIAMVEKSSMTCLAESEEGQPILPQNPDVDLDSDDILKDFLKQRMEAMIKEQLKKKQFVGVEEVGSGDEYLKVVDETDPNVTIILHIYENTISSCVNMNDCLASISTEYQHVRFCKMKGSVAGMSSLFKLEGIPALLVYKGGQLIGNFVRLKDEFGPEFYPGDVENYLIENGIFNSKV